MFLTAIGTRNGELVYFLGSGYMYLCQDNVVEVRSPFEGEEEGRVYYRFDEAYRMEEIERIHVENGKLYTYEGDCRVEITDAEAESIIANHPRIDIEFKPAEEFPH